MIKMIKGWWRGVCLREKNFINDLGCKFLFIAHVLPYLHRRSLVHMPSLPRTLVVYSTEIHKLLRVNVMIR